MQANCSCPVRRTLTIHIVHICTHYTATLIVSDPIHCSRRCTYWKIPANKHHAYTFILHSPLMSIKTKGTQPTRNSFSFSLVRLSNKRLSLSGNCATKVDNTCYVVCIMDYTYYCWLARLAAIIIVTIMIFPVSLRLFCFFFFGSTATVIIEHTHTYTKSRVKKAFIISFNRTHVNGTVCIIIASHEPKTPYTFPILSVHINFFFFCELYFVFFAFTFTLHYENGTCWLGVLKGICNLFTYCQHDHYLISICIKPNNILAAYR